MVSFLEPEAIRINHIMSLYNVLLSDIDNKVIDCYELEAHPGVFKIIVEVGCNGYLSAFYLAPKDQLILTDFPLE